MTSKQGISLALMTGWGQQTAVFSSHLVLILRKSLGFQCYCLAIKSAHYS